MWFQHGFDCRATVMNTFLWNITILYFFRVMVVAKNRISIINIRKSSRARSTYWKGGSDTHRPRILYYYLCTDAMRRIYILLLNKLLSISYEKIIPSRYAWKKKMKKTTRSSHNGPGIHLFVYFFIAPRVYYIIIITCAAVVCTYNFFFFV